MKPRLKLSRVSTLPPICQAHSPIVFKREGEFILCSEDNWIMINAQVIASLPSFDFFLTFYTGWMRKASLSFDPN